MSAPLTEFVIESVIRDGLGDLRSNPAKLDDVFSKFKMTYFNNQYGQAKINQIKTYIQNNQIRIAHSYNQVPTVMPCYSIQLLSSQEREEEQQFSNLYEEVEDPKTPTVYVDPVIPISYNNVTGKIVLDNSVNIANICPGLIFVDNSGAEFVIQSGNSNLAGNKFISILPGQDVDIAGNGRIESAVNFTRTDRRMIRLREVISLGCHANNDIHISKFLYYILLYIIKSRQLSLIERGIGLDNNIGTMFDRVDEFEGEHVYSRFIELHCLTEFDWDQEIVNIVDCFDLDISANSSSGEFVQNVNRAKDT